MVLNYFTFAGQGTWGIRASSWLRMHALEMPEFQFSSVRKKIIFSNFVKPGSLNEVTDPSQVFQKDTEQYLSSEI
jgi:hypothetical protein